jgi:putative ABC transport system permease protein
MSVEQLRMSSNPPAAIQKQIQLPWSKAFEISIKSIKIRFARSLITAGGIFLGIAFYSSVRAAGLFPVGEGAEARAAANRQQWLAIMALLVCFVGIMNSMLMSVTERFKEIGTMKCLGALDSFIVKLFFIEATLMGVIASALGWLMGWLITSVVHLITAGTKDFGASFWSGSLMQMVVSIAIGAGITLLAGIPPASRVASMPAAAALRSEV